MNNSGPTYAKIIGANPYGRYPYRVGLNTLAHNGETFDATPRCGPGGLYYCDIRNICSWVGHGDQLCIVQPVGQIVAVDSKYKTNRLEIMSMISLRKIGTWEFLIEHYVNLHAGNDYALRWAAKEGLLDIVKFLTMNGAYIHALDYHAMCWAAEYGRLEVVKFLVNKGADVHAAGTYALRWAARNGHLEVAKFLVDHGADDRVAVRAGMKLATKHGHHGVAEYLRGILDSR